MSRSIGGLRWFSWFVVGLFIGLIGVTFWFSCWSLIRRSGCFVGSLRWSLSRFVWSLSGSIRWSRRSCVLSSVLRCRSCGRSCITGRVTSGVLRRRSCGRSCIPSCITSRVFCCWSCSWPCITGRVTRGVLRRRSCARPCIPGGVTRCWSSRWPVRCLSRSLIIRVCWSVRRLGWSRCQIRCIWIFLRWSRCVRVLMCLSRPIVGWSLSRPVAIRMRTLRRSLLSWPIVVRTLRILIDWSCRPWRLHISSGCLCNRTCSWSVAVHGVGSTRSLSRVLTRRSGRHDPTRFTVIDDCRLVVWIIRYNICRPVGAVVVHVNNGIWFIDMDHRLVGHWSVIRTICWSI